MSMKKMFRRIDKELKRRVAKDWERHAADFVPKRTREMREQILDAFRHGGIDGARRMLDLHIDGLQIPKGVITRGFTQKQIGAMTQNLQSFFEALKKKAKKGP